MAPRSGTSAAIATARPPAFSISLLHGGQPVGAARDQRHRRAGLRQHLGKPHAKPARRAGHQRHLARQIEQFSLRSSLALDTLVMLSGG